MRCARARDLLAEYAVDGLDSRRRALVEAHLGRCPACRGEVDEMREGLVAMTASLRPVGPPPGLEERVVGRVRAALGARGGRGPSRSRVRVLVAATLAAALLAVSSLGWAFAMRAQVVTLQQRETTMTKRLLSFEAVLRSVGNDGKLYEAILTPRYAGGPEGFGTAAIFNATSGGPSWVMIDVYLVKPDPGAYRVLLQQRSGNSFDAGRLVKTPNGDYVLSPGTIDQSLGSLTSVVILNGAGRQVLAGEVRPYQGGAGGPQAPGPSPAGSPAAASR